MKSFVRLLLSSAIAVSVVSMGAVAGEEPKSTAQHAEPLDRAVEEFKVLTREWGMRPESPPVARIQRGPRMLWHGRVYENLRNDILDAIPHEVKQNGQDQSPLRRNQFGFSVSGPVLIPHLMTNAKTTFFTLSYEGVRERISRASLHTVPTVLERRGDFSETVDQAGNLLPIYDPAATTLNPAYDSSLPVSVNNLQYLRLPFQGNRIPAERLTPDVLAALTLYPLPNTDIGPFSQNNYFVNSPQTNTANGFIAKLDRIIGDRHRVTVGSTISSGFLGPAKYFPNIANPTSPDEHFSTWRADLSYVLTASANIVNTAHIRVGSDGVETGEGSQPPFPRYQLGDYLSMGTPYPESRNARNTLEMSDALSIRKGKHSLRLTFGADNHQVNSFLPKYPSGYFKFSADLTGLPGIINTGRPFASFLLGLSSYGERTIITSPSYFRNSSQSVSVGDKYEFFKDLTIDVGLVFSRRTPREEKYDRQSTVDPSAIDSTDGLRGTLIFAGRNGISHGMRAANIDFSPSVGIAWNPLGDSKTVVRASFNRRRAPIPIYNGQWGTQGFNAHQTFISPNQQLTPALDISGGIPLYPTPLPNLDPSAADNTVADLVDLSGREPLYHTASLSVEREIRFSMVVSLGANYSRGSDILVGDGAANPNAIDPKFLSYRDALYDEDFRVTLQPFPQYKGFGLYSLYPAGRYQRNSAFVRLEKRVSFGLSFMAYYEFSRQFDDYSGPYGNQDFLNLRNNWSLTYYNPPQYVQLSYMYELPFGPDKSLLQFADWRGRLVKGWSISGTAYWNDGVPLAIRPEFNNTGGVLSTLYVDNVPGVDPRVADPGPDLWFNPSAFAQPPDFTMGNGPRTLSNLLGPGYNSTDLSVNKRFPVRGERAFEFSASAFNCLNHANWNYPDTTIGPASAPNINAGRIIGSRGGRVIQLGLRFSF